jgi:hypothetical protein
MALEANMKIEIRIECGAITTSDGNTNSKRLTRTFLTIATPLYATVDYIIMSGGEFLEKLPEASIYAMSFAASTLVDDIVLFDVDNHFKDKNQANWRFFRRARTEFVKSKVIVDLLRAVIASKGTSFGRRLLADFSVDNASLAGIMQSSKPILQDFMSQVSYWQKVLFAGGAVDFESPMMKTAVRAGYHSDNFGGIGRSWIDDSDVLKYKEPSYISGDGMSRPRRFGLRNPMTDWNEA